RSLPNRSHVTGPTTRTSGTAGDWIADLESVYGLLGLVREHLDLPAVALADALGAHTGLFGQRHVDDAPFGRGHRLEGDHVAGLAYLGGDALRHLDERLLAAPLVLV